jgi:hypothetical protein
MAGLFERFSNGLKMRTKPMPDKAVNSVVSAKDDITYLQLSDNVTNALLSDISAIQEFRTISSNRNDKYTGFEEMLEDPIIAAALEMYADDACQYNDNGQIIWAEGDNVEAVKAANRLIDVLDINKNCWRDIYSLCTYGDLYLRLYKEGDESDYVTIYNRLDNDSSQLLVKPEEPAKKYEEYIEYVENPASMFDLQTKGKTAGFMRVCDASKIKTNNIYNSQPLQTVESGNIISYDRMSFIHISLSESIKRNPELLQVTYGEDETDNKIYKVKSGKSILEDAYPVTQTLKLLEDSLVLNRMTRSAILRLVQVEVGDMPKADVTNLLHRYKNQFEQKIAMNVNTGLTKSFNSPGPMDNMVYTPTKNGIGAITVQNIGGDVNVKDIVDLDYFNNKKLAALKIPKQFLNFDSPEGIGGNGVSLTKISSRYAHTIIRIQNAYTQGIADLLNYFFINNKLDYVNKFNIRMVSPSTLEDNERSEKLNNDIGQTRDLLDLVAELDDKERLEVLQYLFSNKLKLSEIAEIIQKHIDNMKNNPEFDMDNENGEFDDFDDFGGGGSRSGGSPFGGGEPDFGGEPSFEMGGEEPMGGNEPNEAPAPEPPTNEPTMTPEA